jgi:hypothetical protein
MGYKFKVGDKVKITEGSDFYGYGGVNNPREVIGEVYKTYEGFGEGYFQFKYDVGWANGGYNSYREIDLVLAEEGYTPKDIKEPDNVNSPSHYGQGEIEAIEYIKDFLTKEEYIGYLRGNIAKYLHRWRFKGKPEEDLKKAQVYLGWLIKEMSE